MVNVPFTYQLKIEGPLRVYPSGLSVTRTIGKHATPPKVLRSPYVDINPAPRGVMAVPEIQYIPISELRWVLLMSSAVMETL